MKFKEIKYASEKQDKVGMTDNRCPACKEKLRYGTIPCPDGKPGCLVLHYGYYCKKCNKYFRAEG